MMKKLIVLIVALWGSVGAFAYTERNLLLKQADMERLKEVLVMNQEWVSYPDYADREGWNAFLGAFKEEYIRRGEKLLDYQWQVVKATDYLAFERTGNRTAMEKPFNDNIYAIVGLLMAELAEGKGRFLDQLINGVFDACEMTSWALAAHHFNHPAPHSLPLFDYPLIDLVSGDLGGVLAWTYYFMHESFDRVNPEISRRLRHELQVRILDAYMNDDTLWWAARNYKGRLLNNWNPWCNSNVLMCFMLLENNREALAKGVYMTMESVDKFLNYIKADGACEEGPSYWGHAAGKALDYLELLSGITGGKVNIFREPMIRNMGEYILRSYVGNDWVVNFADASAKNSGNAHLIYRFGREAGSDELKSFAAAMRKPDAAPSNGRDIYRTFASLAIDKELREEVPAHELRAFTWYPETEFCYLSKGNLFFAAKGGHNDESHNHNDVGSCAVWLNRTPMLIDAGVGTYTKKTFSGERYTIWSMQSNYHNLPLINGVAQRYGKKYKSADAKAWKEGFSVDIAHAYPKEAKVERWVRSYGVKKGQVRIKDSFKLEEAVAANGVNFMTWGEVDASQPGKVAIRVEDTRAELLYDAAEFELEVETIPLQDPRFTRVWGEKICRLAFTAKRKTTQGSYSFTLRQVL